MNYIKYRHGLGVIEKEFLIKNKEMRSMNNLTTIIQMTKKIFMKYSYQSGEIIFSKYPVLCLHQKELVRWLETTAQPIIGQQNEKAKKIKLRTLKESPAIFLS